MRSFAVKYISLAVDLKAFAVNSDNNKTVLLPQVRPSRWLSQGCLVDHIAQHHSLLLSRDVKTTKFNRYAAVVLPPLNMYNQNNRKRVMFQCDVVIVLELWHHSGGARQNVLFLTAASNINTWPDVANDFTQTRLDCG